MPAIRRQVKKATYAGLYGIFAVIILALVILPQLSLFSRNFGRSSEPPPELIQVENINVIRHGGTLDVVAEVRNPNPRYGVPEYTAVFVLLDAADQEIQRIPKDTYLLPGSLNYIAALDIPISPTLDHISIETTDEPIFNKLPTTASAPSFTSFLRNRTITTLGGRQLEVQKGVATNRSTLGYKLVDVTGVAFDVDGNVVGVSTTFIGRFQVGEQREFTLQWPAPISPTDRVIVLPSTNIYDEDNILEVVGDPDRLRETNVEDIEELNPGDSFTPL